MYPLNYELFIIKVLYHRPIHCQESKTPKEDFFTLASSFLTESAQVPFATNAYRGRGFFVPGTFFYLTGTAMQSMIEIDRFRELALLQPT